MQIRARVPMRVDLAGGTLDVYPLYLFEGGGLTVNAAVDICAEVEIVTRADRRVTIHSQDLGLSESFDSLDELSGGGPLSLVHYALAYYRPESGLDTRIQSHAPQGSGIGASSALLMALSAALCRLTGRDIAYDRIIDIGANIEAQVVGIPTGKQDYFPPLYGGVCSIWFGLDGWQIEHLSHGNGLLDLLNERLVVSFTGTPHSSAATNWAMLKSYIERQGDTVARMHEIKEIAQAMRQCLLDRDMPLFYELVDREWQLRRGLAEGVTTPAIERLMAAAAQAGAQASKICGAGGGGCMITVAEPGDVRRVRRALADAGARILPARLVASGLELAVA